jgi:hypothetical protein
MLKLQCKITFNSAFVGKKIHQNRTRTIERLETKHIILAENVNVFLYFKISIGFNKSFSQQQIYHMFERQKHNAMIVILKTNNLSLCLNREYLKYLLQKYFNRKINTFPLLLVKIS